MSHLMLPIDYYLFVLSIFDTLVRSIFQNSTAFKFDSNLRTPGAKKSRKMSLASLPATVQDAESKVELLGAIKDVAIDKSRFLGVLTLAARDNTTLTSMMRVYRRWANQFENVDELWVPNEWNDFWSSTRWTSELKRNELTPLEIQYVTMPPKCQVPSKNLPYVTFMTT